MRRSFLAVCFSFVVTLCQASPITQVVFHGNAKLGSRELTDYLRTLPDVAGRNINNHSELLLAEQHIQEEILKYYTQHGYLKASVDSIRSGLAVPLDSAQGYVFDVYVSEGKQHFLRSIEPELDVRTPQNVFRETDVQAMIRDALAEYEKRGNLLAKIRIESIQLGEDSIQGYVNIRLSIEEGPRARIGKIVLEGNTTTQPEVITRELGLDIGSYYNSDQVAAARSRVERLGFFESVSEPELYLASDSTVSILLHLKESNTSAIDGVLGYIPPRNSNETGYISGLADLSFRNISGTARSASLMYDRRTRESQTLQVAYLEPWILGYPLNADINFLERQQDSTFVRTSFGGNLSLRFTSNLSLVGHIAYDRVIPTDQLNAIFTTYDSRTVTTGLSAALDSRDNRLAPRSGVLAMLGATYGVKSIYGPAKALDSATPLTEGVRTVVFDANGYHALGATNLVGAIGIHARSVSLDAGVPDASDLYRIGGLTSIRGYREEEILASRYAYVNAELRLMTGPYSFFSIFCDNGLTAKDATHNTPAEQPRYLLSYGIGAQMESPLGLIAVSIGLPRGVPADQAKLHFGLVKEF